MTDIQVFMSVSLDGVMQAPARPDEDTRGGFSRGGWALPYADPIMWEGMGRAGSLLLGRRTYEDFYAVWPRRSAIRWAVASSIPVAAVSEATRSAPRTA